MSKRESHKQALRQLFDRHSIGNLRQERGQLIDREHLIDEILRISDRFNGNPSLDEALNSGDGSYRP
ncbi:MAG TPA: hypothetical protein VLE97_11870 [Gaiellaceae bacterium]|nr:hypothetical protein [Gaiellaceae bacterium]